VLLSLDRRWGSWRLLVETFLIATALMLIGAIRRWDDFEHDRVSTYLFVAGLFALAALLYALRGQMERAAR
jgi:hypothetical protein